MQSTTHNRLRALAALALTWALAACGGGDPIDPTVCLVDGRPAPVEACR